MTAAASKTLRVTTVVHKRDQYDVYIGRGSKWGNPYSHKLGTRAQWVVGSKGEAIAKYKEWIKTRPELMAALGELAGKRLGCFCAPNACHGDALVELLEEQATPAPKKQLSVAPRGYDPRAHGARCDECPLNKCKPVPPARADGEAKFVIVGEGPGRLEISTGLPFIGPSGKLLNRVLEKNQLDRRDAHVTNSVLCSGSPTSEVQLAEAQVCCAPRFFAELEKLDPKAPILALGAAAAKMLLGVRGILKTRGFVWKVPELSEKELKKAEKAALDTKSANTKLKPLRNVLAGRMILPMLHPAFIILRSEIWAAILNVDMGRATKLIKDGRLKLEDQSPYVIVSSAHELQKQARKIGPEVTVDIETDSPNPLTARLTCVGIGDTRTTIVAYPFREAMVAALTDIFAKRTIVGHNIIGFDAIVLRRYGVRMVTKIEDTMLAHFAFASHLPKSLLHVASVFCDSGPWKQIAKGEGGKSEKGQPTYIDKLSPEALTRYNAADVRLTALSWRRMQNDLEPERKVYEIDKRMGTLCAEMRRHGFRFDVEHARTLAKTLQGRKNAFLGEMRKVTHNQSFKPSRPNDIRKALFGRFHVSVIRPTPTGLASTARAVLETLRDNDTKAGQLSDLILRWRAADKTKGTYLTVAVGDDGRVHEDWRLGVQSGRLKCRLMTLPKYTPDKDGYVDPTDRVRECYIAAKGWRLVYWDLQQAEMKYAANLSGDPNFIEACKGDVHAGNARVLFPDAVADGSLADDKAAKTIGKKYRDIAKNAGFAVTYLAEWETVYAYLTSHGFPVSTRDVRTMLDRLHVAYAGYFEFVNRNVEFIQKHGYLRSTLSGRIRWFGRYPKPTEAANAPIQTGIADIMNDRLPRVDRQLPRREARIIGQFHDAAVIECREKLVEDMKAIVHTVYDPPIVLPDREPFYIPADLKDGDRLSDF